MNDLNIGDGMFHVPGVIYIIKNERMDIFAYKGKKPDGRTPLYLAPFFKRDRWKRMPGKLHTGETGEPGFSHPVGILGETFLAQ